MAPYIGHLCSKSLPTLSPTDSNIYKTPKRRQFAVLHYGQIQKINYKIKQSIFVSSVLTVLKTNIKWETAFTSITPSLTCTNSFLC